MANYKYDGAEVWEETTENEIPTNPKTLKLRGLMTDTLVETQKEETNPNISASAQGARKDYGTSDFAGNLGIKVMGDMMPFCAVHTIGKPTTKTDDYNTGTWTSTTSYTIFNEYVSLDDPTSGDVIKHSDGIHTLVCQVSGDSDATEPDLTNVKVGDIIDDGTAKWKVAKLKYRYIGEMGCRPSFGFEMKGVEKCATVPSDFIRRYQGIYANTFEISKSNGVIIYKYDLPVVASYATDNVSDENFTSIKDETGYTSVAMVENPFAFQDMRVRFDDLAPVDAKTFRLTVNRNTTLEDAVEEDKKVSDTPQPVVDGELNLKFTKEEYLKSYRNEASEVACLFGKKNADIAQFIFPYVERTRVSPEWSTEMAAYLTVPLTASGDEDTTTIAYDILSEIDYSSQL